MDEGRPRPVGLSPRQTEILQGYADGKTREEIAQALDIVPITVSSRMTEIKYRLKTNGIEESIKEARRLGLLAD